MHYPSYANPAQPLQPQVHEVLVVKELVPRLHMTSRTQCCVLTMGCLQLILGVACIGFNSMAIAAETPFTAMVAPGIWGGIFVSPGIIATHGYKNIYMLVPVAVTWPERLGTVTAILIPPPHITGPISYHYINFSFTGQIVFNKINMSLCVSPYIAPCWRLNSAWSTYYSLQTIHWGLLIPINRLLLKRTRIGSEKKDNIF